MLIERYRRKVFSIAYGMVHNTDAAMDISQEVFIKVHRYLGAFQGSSSFYTWLYRLVVNACIDSLRRQRRHDALDYDEVFARREPDGAEASIVPRLLDQNPLEAYDRKELRGHIARAFEELSEKHRAVLMLREIEGLSYEEIAQALRIHKGTVMSRLHHARRNMQRALLNYLQERGADFREVPAGGEPAAAPGCMKELC